MSHTSLAYTHDQWVMDEVPIHLREDHECITESLLIDPWVYESLDEIKRGVYDYALIAVSLNKKMFALVPEPLNSNRRFLAEVLQMQPRVFEMLPNSFRSDRELARIALACDGDLIRCLDTRLSEDTALLSIGVADDSRAIYYVDECLQKRVAWRAQVRRLMNRIKNWIRGER